MTDIEFTREKVRQFKGLLNNLEDPEIMHCIKQRLEKNQFRLVFLIYEKKLEQSLDGLFDKAASLKLDAIRVLLED